THFKCICCGACCSQKDMIVTLTGRDISYLAHALGLDAKQMLRVVDFYIQTKAMILPQGLQNIPRIETERGLAIIALKKNPTGECIFLENDLCMVHPARPGVCKSFPFTFREENDEISYGLSAKQSICPGIGQGDEILVNELLILAQEILEDLSIFSEFVSYWNDSEHEHEASMFLEAVLADIRFIV
ncbi:MAG: YkgJ family cysteine cluster protein, partial [Candidatus Thorarchaeota archaeon]